MSRRTVAADRRPSHKSSSWVRRFARFKNRFPRLLRTDYWRSSQNRGLWDSLFLKSKKSKSSRTTSTKRGRNQARLQLESLEERRLLTINVAVIDRRQCLRQLRVYRCCQSLELRERHSMPT